MKGKATMNDERTRADVPFLDDLIGLVQQLLRNHLDRFPIADAEREDFIRRRQSELLADIEDIITDCFDPLRDLWCEVNPDATPRWDEDFLPVCLAVSAWADHIERYDRQRSRLSEFLQALREGCDGLDQERIDRICNADRLLESHHAWEDLSERQQKIVEYLLTLERGKKRSEKELARALGHEPASLKRELADLRKRLILGNRKGEGYWVRRIPRGTPHRIRLAIE